MWLKVTMSAHFCLSFATAHIIGYFLIADKGVDVWGTWPALYFSNLATLPAFRLRIFDASARRVGAARRRDKSAHVQISPAFARCATARHQPSFC
jgi:hypothetical protein